MPRTGSGRPWLGALALTLLLPLQLGGSCSQPIFEEASGPAGLLRSGQSWGAAWGDWNGDGHPDLFLSNHGEPPSLYENDGAGTFVDRGPQLIGTDAGDMHGATFVDVDGDGDQDLVEIGGGGGAGANSAPNRVFVNEGGALVDRAAELGLDVDQGRGRTSQWWDWDGDGLLDVAIQNVQGGDRPRFFYQTGIGLGFTATTLLPETLSGRSPNFAQLVDLDGDASLEMISYGWPDPNVVYRIDAQGFSHANEEFGVDPVGGVQDAAVADFDGDLLPDVLMLHHPSREHGEIFQPSPTELRARIAVDGDARGIDFPSPGTVSLEFDRWRWSKGDVFIGAAGANPPSILDIALSSDDPAVHGLPAFTPGVSKGIFVGYVPAEGLWKIRLSHPNSPHTGVLARNPAGIGPATPVGFVPGEEDGRGEDTLFLHEGGVLVDRTAGSGLEGGSRCNSVGVGDFDNDGDQDLFYVCTGSARNWPNRLFLNQGDGTFVEKAKGGGAAGVETGMGDAVAVADYDEDGFLDLLVTNGEGGPPLHDGPVQLFRNRGNPRHWLQLDLRGTASNRDAIGARVIVWAGGVPRARFQLGGFHHAAQDHQRLHFGLGESTEAELVVVEWPSGQTSVLEDVAADQILTVTESP